MVSLTQNTIAEKINKVENMTGARLDPHGICKCIGSDEG